MNILKCPHCESDQGYYNKARVSGVIQTYFNFDGSEAENGEMYEHLTHKSYKWCYCCNCNKKLFKISV